MIKIRKARDEDFDDIWDIFHRVVKTGDTFAFDPASNRKDCRALWMSPNIRTYIAELQCKILGTYILRKNQPGLGAHVANAAYMVHPDARRKGIGWAMGMRSVKQAKKLGFSAIQFNFVVSTNLVAVELWLKLGFRIVGIVPKAFNHKKLGMVDVYIMHKFL
ncbi:MAG: GNAT family N-acetyltransferase [Planctomycetes bacterium RIFCSPHIGHO2_02_FULL_38_41]|nr:MAG: GNAT family N-acetyltransferase [Planctomycetes bacterium RIFCSPHIGHO2_02_FULL_38_41]OHB96880.1 MAG: GNAT family N-acetyltransferase [Planctomycetes bacterium RIFCSPLOWO2_12_38_17]OHC03968.1 MAG: GNAT family N-acetyltransferase [Planctomycetes bacterium RIFCSPHIGHO2_12_39_6]